MIRFLIPLLLLSWIISWDQPPYNCDGTPLLDFDHWEIPTFYALIDHWTTCAGEDGATSPCPVYVKSFTRHSTLVPSLTLPDPGPAEVIGYEWPEAFDRTGLSSADCVGPT